MHPAFSTATFSASSAAFSFSCRLNHRLLYPSSFYERRAPSVRRSAPLAAPKKARLAKGRPASWRSLADQYPPPRTRTDGHACARCGPLSFSFFPSFPFRYRFAALLSARLRCSPIPLFYPSVPFLVSQPRSLFLLSLSPPSPSPHRAVTLVFPDSPSSSVLLAPAASLFSCYLFVFRALDFSPASFTVPSDFSSPLCPSTVLLPFVYYPPGLLSFNPFLPRRSIFLPFVPLSTYPRRLRRDGPIFSSRFLGSDIFYTFFSPRLPPPPSPTAAHAPLSPAIGISPRASAPSPSLPRRTYAHGLSLPLVPSILRPFPPLIRPPLASLSPLFHFSLPFTLASLSFSLAPYSTPAAPIFLIFFSQLPDHLPTPRVGVLFLSGRSSRPSARPRTRVHTRTLAACARGRDGEIKKGVKRELVDVGGKGGPRGAREEGG